MSDKSLIGEVDLEKSSIEVDSEWMTTTEIKSAIKTRIESGDFDVTLYASALKKLERTLSSLEEVQLRMPLNVLNAYKEIADDRSVSLESCLRTGVTEYLRHQDSGAETKAESEPSEKKSAKKKSKGKHRSK